MTNSEERILYQIPDDVRAGGQKIHTWSSAKPKPGLEGVIVLLWISALRIANNEFVA